MALADTISRNSEISVRIVPEVGTDPVHDIFFVLAEGIEQQAFHSALDSDHTVIDHNRIESSGDQQLSAVTFSADTKLLAPHVTMEGGLSLEATGTIEGWVERWQLPDRGSLHSIWEYAIENAFRFEILDLYRHDDTAFRGSFGLTGKQRQTLTQAAARGYFKEPRTVSLSELAEELDVSPTAASGRLRRGIDKLIETTLID